MLQRARISAASIATRNILAGTPFEGETGAVVILVKLAMLVFFQIKAALNLQRNRSDVHLFEI
ncbi:hypothetical protein KCP74_19850 [Salmonella enterica subsp. enterica]|nr:hypothetical protein KCP74_19850 [Salmonella enterica subsp. enterica]